MPGLIKLYNDNPDKRDKFTILAFHEPGVKTFRDLDPHLERLKNTVWKGQSLPFPVLLDATGTTLKAYGINGFPTLVLIDPSGRIVRSNPEEVLKKKLNLR
jgi:hypothetical protein